MRVSLLAVALLPAVAGAGIEAIDFELTVALDEGMGEVCGRQDSLRLSPGDRVYFCYRVENTGGVAFTVHDLVDSELGAILSGFRAALEPGASLSLTQLVEITAHVRHTAIWSASAPGVSAQDSDSVTVSIGTPGLDLDVTVAPSSGDPDIDSVLCGTEEWITVPAGSDVVFCYEATNSGEVRLDRHDLEDDVSGSLLNDFAFSLEPGGSVFLTQTVPVATSVVNDALWFARNSVDPALSAAASDAAVVAIPEPGPAATSGASGLALALLASHGRRARRAARGGCRRAG